MIVYFPCCKGTYLHRCCDNFRQRIRVKLWCVLGFVMFSGKRNELLPVKDFSKVNQMIVGYFDQIFLLNQYY